MMAVTEPTISVTPHSKVIEARNLRGPSFRVNKVAGG